MSDKTFFGPILANRNLVLSLGSRGGMDNGHNNSPGARADRNVLLITYK